MEELKTKNFLNEVVNNSKGTPMKIIGFRNKSDIDVQFLDDFGYIKEHTLYANFIKGNIKNPYDKNICGVGYFGEGKHKCKYSNGIHTSEYQNWISMIRRCYDLNRKNTYPAYYGKCEVCKEWHNFQNFAEWYNKNFYQVGTERIHIDKDILIKDNKLYSPETCILVPQRINMLFVKKPNRYNLPNGVKPSLSGKFEAKYNEQYLGIFDTVEDAARAHNQAKKEKITDTANEYKDRIPNKVYQALINWIPDYI